MNKIKYIIAREFLTRVQRKSFWVLALLGPFLIASVIVLPVYFASLEDKEIKVIAVVDSSRVFVDRIPETKNLKFRYVENVNIARFIKNFQQEGYWGVLYISHVVTYSPNSVILFSHGQPGLAIKYHIENALKKEIEHRILQANGIEGLDKTLQALKSNVNLRMIKLDDQGNQKDSNTTLAMIVGYTSGFLIYLFIFLFGSQVMRGVIEEKTNRIIEVIVSSVRPFELMMGKIIGVAGVAILQFILWTGITFMLVSVGREALFPDLKRESSSLMMQQNVLQPEATKTIDSSQVSGESEGALTAHAVFEAIRQIDFVVILSSFLFFFLGGYLLYGALFAAIGSLVDNEADTQQFMLPVTIPLILAIYVMINTINNPDSALSFWFSMIPLTSPIVMMVRIPFGVPYWEVAVSMILLIAAFVFFTWFSAKIYRTAILMYGKQISYKEIWKWFKHS
ncbi:MAG TPA: ABC transporter permease [Bacteroidales bacterium]|nr:ABC transporter permease [Bacteroidales bacterium]HPO64572.1 ABC transporter permease [Bacteroidales bacterium]